MYLFGSALIKKYFPDFREPNDLDYLSNKSVPVSSTRHVEYYSIPFAPDRELTPNEIYTLKVSHVIYDIYWRKHMSDIRFLQLKGCRIDKVFLADLRAFWLTVHSYDFMNKNSCYLPASTKFASPNFLDFSLISSSQALIRDNSSLFIKLYILNASFLIFIAAFSSRPILRPHSLQ